MKRWLAIGMLVLAGCANAPSQNQESYSGTAAGIGNESPERHRARLHTDLGAGYFSQNKLAIALEEFSSAVQIDPGYPGAYNGLGLVYAALREDDKAEANFKRAVQLEPSNSESHNNYGTFLCSRNRIDDSIKEFMAALKNPLYSSPESAWMNAGICALRKGDEKNAETYLVNAVQIQPNLRNANYQLANLYFKHGNKTLANRHIQFALQEGAPTADVAYLGWRIARAVGDQNAEASLALLLRNQFPDSEQARAAREASAQ
jgi:type IV pilus assembly protein PilF